MTTIACDGKMMAGDGLCTGGGLIHDRNVKKVFRANDGSLIGICGNAYNLKPFIGWFNDQSLPVPQLEYSEFEALVLTPDGRCLSYDGNCQFIEQPLPAVCGAGGMVAMGAMLAGGTAFDAVTIAAAVTTQTGGEIYALMLDGSELQP